MAKAQKAEEVDSNIRLESQKVDVLAGSHVQSRAMQL